MSTPKKTKKKPAPPPPPPQPAKQNAEDTYDPTKDRHALLELVARTGPCDDGSRAAFELLIDDDGRVALGDKTRARGVFRDAVAWAVVIDGAFTDYGESLKEYYPRARFAYYLDRALALDTAAGAQEARRSGQGSTHSTTSQQEQATRAVRDNLIFKLERFAGRRTAEREALTAAKGRTDTTDALGQSILALVTLGRSWLQRDDAPEKTLCALVGLHAALLDDAVDAAKALTGAAKDMTLAGRRRAADLPEVNLVEGTVLHEMEEAMDCLAMANARTKVIPRLSPGAATRHVLGSKTTPKKAATAADAKKEPATADE